MQLDQKLSANGSADEDMYTLGFFYTLLLFANICKFWDVGLDIDVEGIFHFEGGLGILYLDEQSYNDLGTYSIPDCSIGTFLI